MRERLVDGLHTRDSHTLYARLGFWQPLDDERLVQRGDDPSTDVMRMCEPSVPRSPTGTETCDHRGDVLVRSRSMRVMLPVVLLVAIASLAAGCGGSSSSNKSSSSGGGGSTTTTTQSTTTEAAMTTTSGASGSAADCPALAKLAVKFGQAMASATPSSGTPSANVQQAAKEFQQFANSVPSSVRADFQVLAKAFTDYANTLAGLHLTAGKVPSASDITKLEKAAKVFNTAKLRAAEARLAAWAKKTCPKVSFPSSP